MSAGATKNIAVPKSLSLLFPMVIALLICSLGIANPKSAQLGLDESILAVSITSPGAGAANVERRPVVLFLPIASSADTAEMERAIISKMTLTLDRFEVATAGKDMAVFRDASMSKRLALLKGIPGIRDAVATVWVEQGQGILLLNLVAFSTGQALVRIVEAKEGPETPEVLALTVQELLGQAYLFQDRPLPEQLRQTVEIVSDTAASAKVRRGETDDGHAGSPWALLLSAGGQGGVVSRDGPSLKFAATIALERTLGEHPYLSPWIGVLLGPKQRDGDVFHSAIGASVGLGAGYRFRFGRFALSPRVSAAGTWRKSDFGYPEVGIDAYHWFDASFFLDVRVEWHISSTLFLSISPGVAVNLVQKYFHRASDHHVIWKSPRMEWMALGTVGINL